MTDINDRGERRKKEKLIERKERMKEDKEVLYSSTYLFNSHTNLSFMYRPAFYLPMNIQFQIFIINSL